MKKVVLVTQDVGPGNAFRLIGERLASAGNQMKIFLGAGKPFPESNLAKMIKVVGEADCLLIGVSSTPERVVEERRAFVEAKKLNIPVAIFSDTYGVYTRPWFADLMATANILFVIDEQEKETARKYVSPTTRIIHASNPCWADYFGATVGRDEVRSKLGIKPEEKMILAGGSKEHDRNCLLFGDLVDVANLIDGGLHLILTMHPGANHMADVYDDILKKSRHPVRFASKKNDGLDSQQMIEGSDLVVCGGSTVSIMAACRRKPVIDLMHEIDYRWWKGLSGLDFWPPTALGASAATSSDLEETVRALLNTQSTRAQQMLAAQEENFSYDAYADAAERIAAALTK